MAVNEWLSMKIETGQRFTKAEAGELSSWFCEHKDDRGSVDWMLMGGDDARDWAEKFAGPTAKAQKPGHKAPAKYDGINFTPTRSMADAAQQGLDYRDEYERGGTEVGIARARDISNRENLSPETVGRMVSFFARHADNRDPDAEESDGGPSNGWIAWLLWGGDPGKAWADKVAAQVDAADESEGSDDDKRGKAEGGDVDAGDPGDSEAGSEADESGDQAGEDQGAGKDCQCCKTNAPDEPEGDVAKAVEQYGPDAAYMPITFKGYPNWKANEEGEATGEADETVRDGEPETPIQRMQRRMAEAFREQEAAVLEALKGMKAKSRTKADGDDFMDDPRIDDILASMGVGMLVEAVADSLKPMIAAGAQSGADAIGMGGGGDTPPGSSTGGTGDSPGVSVGFDVSNPLVERAARNRAIVLAGDLNQTSIERLRASLADGLAKGESIPQLSRRVSEQFESFSTNRAETIARTESALSYEQGQLATWKESGVVEGKMVLLAPGACQFCEAIAQQYKDKTVALDGVFVPKGGTIRGTSGGTMKVNYRDLDSPWFHPNCRCSMKAVLSGDFKSLQDALTKGDTKAVRKFWSEHNAK